jgi:hypothetical protein
VIVNVNSSPGLLGSLLTVFVIFALQLSVHPHTLMVFLHTSHFTGTDLFHAGTHVHALLVQYCNGAWISKGTP